MQRKPRDTQEAVAQLRARGRAGRKKKVRGFEKNAKRIAARQGISEDRARAILASGARYASPKAKRLNPRLRKVKG